jgi:hypothetical protein
MGVQIRFGAIAPPLSEQLKGIHVGDQDLLRFQASADAIVQLYFDDLIPDSQVDKIRTKLGKRILKAVDESPL